jgi:hypothetical protein
MSDVETTAILAKVVFVISVYDNKSQLIRFTFIMLTYLRSLFQNNIEKSITR